MVTAMLGTREADVLRQVAVDLGALLDPASTGGDKWREDPVLDRLFPRAYLDPTEETAEAEWQDLVHSDLVEARQEALRVFGASLARARPRRGHVELDLTQEEAEAWLSVLNDVRLALGTRLQVTEDLDPSAIAGDHPDAPAYAVYWWLGWAQEHLVDALAAG
jgi:uncharacterized protein DUF2017